MLNFTLNKQEEHQINIYQTMLIDYQNKINLISNNTVKDLWTRHIVDSAQLYPIIRDSNNDSQLNIIDIGTGAGLPGIVLAILDKGNNYFLVDSNGKKTKFLELVKKELLLTNIEILNMRIEDVILKKEKFDIVVSRALCKLNKLYSFSKALSNDKGFGLFFKGKTYQEEVNELILKHKYMKNKIMFIQSITNPESKIIKIYLDKKGD